MADNLENQLMDIIIELRNKRKQEVVKQDAKPDIKQDTKQDIKPQPIVPREKPVCDKPEKEGYTISYNPKTYKYRYVKKLSDERKQALIK